MSHATCMNESSHTCKYAARNESCQTYEYIHMFDTKHPMGLRHPVLSRWRTRWRGIEQTMDHSYVWMSFVIHMRILRADDVSARTQTHRLIDTKTHRHTLQHTLQHTHTHTHTHRQMFRGRQTTRRQLDTLTHWHTDKQTHRHTDTHCSTHCSTNCNTYCNTHCNTHTRTHTRTARCAVDGKRLGDS